ncbi:M48 family metallopeptidase [Thalassotalea psychrophila]|uniref:M48 family metallopeptidase n=1 Tax=Thalassotalea psychrophila TaxID=3065647 RepID=A0ABY9TQ12_9GAMM|nr:M48 family metallopeptidase [Colwelliaceae bacterium SQ149]
MKKTLLITLTVFTLIACSTSPTGRRQVLLHSSSELDKMGAQSFEQMKEQEPISKDKKVNQFVQCVANYITPNVKSTVHKGEWEIVVFDSEQVNAFALPGGKIGVYTGILNVTENADQLAAIIGHEVGHVIAQHSNERLSSNQLSKGALVVAGAAAASSDIDNKALVVAGAAVGMKYLLLMPYGRAHESEADIIGQDLMAKSGFDPRASVKLWQNMAKLSKDAPPEFFSTHPSNQTRISDLTKHLQVSEPLYAQRNVNPECIKPVIPKPKSKAKPVTKEVDDSKKG